MIYLLKTRPLGSFERPGTVPLGALLQEIAYIKKKYWYWIRFLVGR